MEHNCNKEGEIAEIKTIVKALESAVNGQTGLIVIVAKLTVSVDNLASLISSMQKTRQFNLSTIISIVAIVVAIWAVVTK